MKQQFIAYYRVSTKKQGATGWGLDAQKEAVKQFVKDGVLIAEFTEVESGKKDDRTELKKAIELSKVEGAKLVIAKLDRISRKAGFIFALRDSGVDFICADMPDANTLTIGIFAVMAQHERELISKRTKEGLQAAKAKGVKLGKPENLNNLARQKGVKVRQQNAATSKENKQAAGIIALHINNGGATLQTIADYLNDNGYTTRTGGKFHPTTVKRLSKTQKFGGSGNMGALIEKAGATLTELKAMKR